MAISHPWDNIAGTDVDPDSPITTGLMTALVSRDDHHYDWIGKDFTPADNHNHDGVNSALIAQASAINLCVDPFPMTSGSDNEAEWLEWAAKGGGTTVQSKKGLLMQASGAFGRITLTGNDGYGDQALGSGADLVVALLVMPEGALSTGELRFGLSDGDNSNFMSGGRAIADWTDLPGPTRLWSFFPKSVGSFSTSFDLLVRVTSAFDAPLSVTAFTVNLGQTLSPMTFPVNGTLASHRYNQCGKGEVPWMDQQIMMDDAVFIAPS